MRLLSWNIQHGGGTRCDGIITSIVSHAPDVIALSEFRTRTGVALCAGLAKQGWQHFISTNPAGSDNGLCVMSRTPIVQARRTPRLPEKSGSWLDVEFPEHGFGTSLLHILCSAPKSEDRARGAAKIRFWDAVIRAAARRSHEPFLLIGDWNTGAHYLDEPGRTIICADHFGKLTTMGWTDLWRSRNPEMKEWSWYSRLGNGFRLDHAFASPGLSPRVTSCRYSHAEREGRISDHSILLVEIASTS